MTIVDQIDRFTRLALKAQGQCRATIETLALMKNPPTVFARQANIAHGPQQVDGLRSDVRGRHRRSVHEGPPIVCLARVLARGRSGKWRPWEHATGPRSVAGKARSSRNAYRGGYRPTWRAVCKVLNAELRARRNAVATLTADWQRPGEFLK
jgi:hypothetical protein